MPVTESIRRKVSALPHKPGVYLMKDRFGTVIYVGKARDLRKRVSQYFHPSRRRGWDLKFNALVEAIHDFDVHLVRSEPEAYLLEGKLIKEFHPRYNISFRDDKRFLLLKVNLNDPIPRFTLTRLKHDDGARYFGPFVSSGAMRRTLDLVRHRFNLRGCRPLTPAEADYRHCLYAHLRVCTAPCIGNVTREQYLMQVLAACDFLDGQCVEMKEQIEAQMQKAAAALDFEKAAELRDLLADLRHTTRKTKEFVRLPYSLPMAVDPENDLAELAAALGLPAPPRRIEGFDISNISGTFAVASMVSFKNGRPDRSNYRRFRMKTVVGQDDFACMAETIRRRYTRLLREAKERHPPRIEEGGEASPQELQQAIDDISAAAQGKRIRPMTDASAIRRPRPAGTGAPADERADAEATECQNADAHAYSAAQETRGGDGSSTRSGDRLSPPRPLTDTRCDKGPGRSPLNPPSSASNFPDLILIDGGKGQLNAACAELARLGLTGIPVIGLAKEFEEIYRPAAGEPLRLSHDTAALKLLQRVRDESHRFANTYNAQLRLKRISESMLDEFPGIGEQRKAALLKRFGSVHRLRLATVEQIAEVPGFGGRAAAELKAFLEARSVTPPPPPAGE